LRLSFAGRTLTHFGGLVLFHRFVQRLGLRTLLGRRVWLSQRNNRYSVGGSLLAVWYPIILGLGRIEGTQLLQRNDLAGLPAYPDPQTLRRFLLRFAAEGREHLVRLHDDLRTTLLEQPPPPHSVIFDLDSAVLTVYGRQGGAEVGFNPHKHGRRSYQGRSRDCWEASYHPENTHVATVTLPLLERAFTKLPPGVRDVRIRADGAFSDGKLIEWLEAHKAHYTVVARLTKPLQARLAGARYHPWHGGVAFAEFSYAPLGWPGPRRFIAIRRPIPEEPSWQLHLFRMGKYLYQAIVTDLDLTPLHVWRFYNDRAEAELVIRELKEAYALGKIPSRRWQVDEAYFQLVVFAYHLLNWFRRLCLPPELQRWTLRTPRNQLLLVPAELVRPHGIPTLRLFPHQQAFWTTLKSVDRIRV
jgi:hypothetical protein